jgi:hypothetical protein
VAWRGTLLYSADVPMPQVYSAAFLHTPAGVLLVTITGTCLNEHGLSIYLRGEGDDPGMLMGNLEYLRADSGG